VGYYYSGCDIDGGSAALAEAIQTHDANLESYAAKSDKFISQFSPKNRKNIDNYARALLSLI
jgi:hypothetical protein